MDVDTLQPGTDFLNDIQKQVRNCDIILVVIGRQWLTCSDKDGGSRLAAPQDFVRMEIEAALSGKVLLVPVLVGGALPPKSTDLPDSLAPLARIHALEISDLRFHHDVDTLMALIDKHANIVKLTAASNDSSSRRLRPVAWAAGILLVAAGVMGGLFLWHKPANSTQTESHAETISTSETETYTTISSPLAQPAEPIKSTAPGSPIPSTQNLRRGVDFDVTIEPQHQKFLPAPNQSRTTRTIADLQAEDQYTALKYNYERTDGKLRVGYQMPYLTAYAKGFPVRGLDAPFLWGFPTLSIKLVNNTTETIFLSELTVEVIASGSNTDPVLTIGEGTWNRLDIVNEGWGQVVAPQLDFAIIHELRAEAGNLMDAHPVHHHIFETFTSRTSLPLTDFVKDMVINFVKDGQPVSHRIPPSGKHLIHGQVTYQTETGTKHVMKFETTVNMGIAPIESIAVSNVAYALPLTTGLAGQTKRVPISQYVKPGEVDSFLLTVAPDKSGWFDLQLKLHAVGQGFSPALELRLEAFVPRSQQRQYGISPIPRIEQTSASPAP